MIPRLEAEESIAAAERVAIGTGSSKSPGAVIKRWERLAGGGALRPAAPPAMFSPEVLAKIPVRRVVKGSKDDG